MCKLLASCRRYGILPGRIGVHMAKASKKSAHHHSHQKSVVRLKRAAGHLESVIGMVADERPCGEILQQLTAVISALGSARSEILQEHLKSCLRPALKTGFEPLVDDIELVVQRAMKV